jgi:hypothetical protein
MLKLSRELRRWEKSNNTVRPQSLGYLTRSGSKSKNNEKVESWAVPRSGTSLFEFSLALAAVRLPRLRSPCATGRARLQGNYRTCLRLSRARQENMTLVGKLLARC